jgi:hypothetical protein
LFKNWEEHEAKAKKGKDDGAGKLYLFHAVLILCRSTKSRLVDMYVSLVEEDWNREGGSKKIPEYAYDMFTTVGKIRKRGPVHFLKESAQIEPHAELKGEQDIWNESLELYEFMEAHGGLTPSQHVSPTDRKERRSRRRVSRGTDKEENSDGEGDKPDRVEPQPELSFDD